MKPITKITNSKTERASKYHRPYTKTMLNNIAKILVDNINAGLLSYPFYHISLMFPIPFARGNQLFSDCP